MKTKNTCLMIALAGLAIFAISTGAAAQSPDSKICTCWSAAVSSDHLLATSAVYGRVGVKVSRNMELKPGNGQPVRFTMPALPVRSPCQNYYSIYITDENNRVVHQSEGTNPTLSYTFSGCNRTFTVQLMTFSKPPSGSGGACSRRISFRVKPQC